MQALTLSVCFFILACSFWSASSHDVKSCKPNRTSGARIYKRYLRAFELKRKRTTLGPFTVNKTNEIKVLGQIAMSVAFSTCKSRERNCSSTRDIAKYTHLLNHKSVCNWKTSTKSRWYKYPELRQTAKCLCNDCGQVFSKKMSKDMFKCVPVLRLVPVLEWNDKCKWAKSTELVSVGCTCAKNPFNKAKFSPIKLKSG